MASPPVKSGFVDFHVPSAGKPCQTWYTIHGDLQPGTTRPLVIVHGGPGGAHKYMLPAADVASAPYNIPCILYDQLGCGSSTHLPEKNGDGTFWTVQLFLDELDNLLRALGIQDDYDLLGHSWGGMLGSEHAVRHPTGLRKFVISCSPADMRTWVSAANRLRGEMPEGVQKTLTECEEEGRTDSKEYEAAVEEYYNKHVCRLSPWPEELLDAFEEMKRDPTVSMTMSGPSEFFVSGTLKNWSISDQLHKVAVPTLLLNGEYDEAQDECVEPFVKNIPGIKWVKFANSSHSPLWEERAEYKTVVGDFLTS